MSWRDTNWRDRKYWSKYWGFRALFVIGLAHCVPFVYIAYSWLLFGAEVPVDAAVRAMAAFGGGLILAGFMHDRILYLS